MARVKTISRQRELGIGAPVEGAKAAHPAAKPVKKAAPAKAKAKSKSKTAVKANAKTA